MDFHAIKTCGNGVFGGLCKGLHDGGNFAFQQSMGRGLGQHALRGVGIAIERQGAGRNNRRSTIVGWVCGATCVPDLHEDFAALGVHSSGSFFPGFDLCGVVNSGFVDKGRSVFGNHGALGDDQSGAGALLIVLGHECVGQMPCTGTRTGQRCHEHAVGQGNGADLKRAK